MAVFVKTLSDLLALFLQVLRLSMVLPAAAFVGLNFSFILPQLKETVIGNALIEPYRYENIEIFLALFACIFLAYIFSVANIPIIRFFEGYPWWSLGKRLRQMNIRRVHFLKSKISAIDQDIYRRRLALQGLTADEENNIAQKQNLEVIINKLQMEKNILVGELSMYPHHQTWRILPSKLGNVIASAEEYSGHMFGLDAITFWPFLVPIISENGYAPYVEREKATLDFLLNMTVVTLLFGGELVYLDILLGTINIPSFFLKTFVTLIVAFVLYLLSVQGALSWGYTIRTAIVLYREQLQTKLNMRKPKNFYEERIQWKKASRFFFEHDITPGNYIFDYHETTENKDK